MRRILAIICAVLALVLTLSVAVSAEPTDAFTHVDNQSGGVKTIVSREMYRSAKVINATTLGLEESLAGLTDLCCDQNGNVYVIASEISQVIVLNSDFTYQRSIQFVDQDGFEVSLAGAQGIFVDANGLIYLCDQRYEQVLIANQQGKVQEIITQPESNLIPDDFMFLPYRLVCDEKGYMYILSEGSYYGALAYSPERDADGNRKFLGFYGANNVKTSALDTLSFIWDKITQTDAKKSASIKTIPAAFVDIALDSKGYIITCTGKNDKESNATNGTGQIRKLSPGGEDILYKRSSNGTSQSSQELNFLEEKVLTENGASNQQNISAIDVDSDNFIYALDKTYGLVYVYDRECNMLGGFGGRADGARQAGVFSLPTSLMVCGDSVVIIDKESCCLTVFEITEYGKLLKQAQNLYLNGNYLEAKDLWQQVLAQNRDCQLAYKGLAMVALVEEDYEQALDYAEKGLDYTVYDMAHKKIVSQNISKNFTLIAVISVLVLGGLIAFFVIIKKKKIVLIKNIKVKTALRTVFHPFDTFNDVKYKDYGSVWIAIILLVLFYISKVLNKTVAGFLFLTSSPANYNMFYTIGETFGLVLLWSLANWLVSSILSGNGNFKQVFIGTNYALIPLILFNFVRVLLSHVLPLNSAAAMDGIQVAVYLLTFFLLAVALMAIHEFDFFKFLSTTIVSILFMILAVFVLLLILVLMQQIKTFFVDVYNEIFYR